MEEFAFKIAKKMRKKGYDLNEAEVMCIHSVSFAFVWEKLRSRQADEAKKKNK